MADPIAEDLKDLKNTELKPVDAPPVNDHTDPLVVPPPPAQTQAQKLDARHATKAGGKGYAARLCGIYFANSTDGSTAKGGKVQKKYDVTVNVPKVEGALSLIKNRLLDPALKKKYSDYLTFRTHEIVSMTPLSPNSPEPNNNLQYMSRERLEQYIAFNSVPIDLKDYAKEDVGALRSAVIDHKVSPQGFEKREAKRQKKRKVDQELLDMNPDLKEDDPILDVAREMPTPYPKPDEVAVPGSTAKTVESEARAAVPGGAPEPEAPAPIPVEPLGVSSVEMEEDLAKLPRDQSQATPPKGGIGLPKE